jgi:2-polyprenyl-3-methyl-5-hydroxy-6-metoxy-1,4-benzoquinol methylase
MPWFEFYYADLNGRWPVFIRAGEFDVIVSIETLEHLPDQDTFVAECRTHLAPGGVLVLACPIGDGPSETNPWHIHEPTEAELRALLAEHFAHVELTTENYESTSGPAVQAWAVCR